MNFNPWAPPRQGPIREGYEIVSVTPTSGYLVNHNDNTGYMYRNGMDGLLENYPQLKQIFPEYFKDV